MGEIYYSRNVGPKLQMILVCGRAESALTATPRREGTGIFRLSSTLSLLFLDQCSRHELVWGCV